MSRCVNLCVRTSLAAVAISLCTAVLADAQVTIVLETPDRDVIDTVIQSGRHASANLDRRPLAIGVRDADESRAVLKFNTHTQIPRNARIQSAALTLTVRGGDQSARTLSGVATCVIVRWNEPCHASYCAGWHARHAVDDTYPSSTT